MGIYDVVKDAANVARKADNIELYKILLDVQEMALDMQKELTELRDEIKNLKDISELTKKIVRYPAVTYVTLIDDQDRIVYCSRCWDKDKNLIQVSINERGQYQCHECSNNGLFSKEMQDEYNKGQAEVLASLNRSLYRKGKWDMY